MSKRLSSEQKKKRLAQLRDAQRRRRAKLKIDSQRFVQVILPTDLLDCLRKMALESRETVQHLICRLVQHSVRNGNEPEKARVPIIAAPTPEIEEEEVPEPATAASEHPGQLNLFFLIFAAYWCGC